MMGMKLIRINFRVLCYMKIYEVFLKSCPTLSLSEAPPSHLHSHPTTSFADSALPPVAPPRPNLLQPHLASRPFLQFHPTLPLSEAPPSHLHSNPTTSPAAFPPPHSYSHLLEPHLQLQASSAQLEALFNWRLANVWSCFISRGWRASVCLILLHYNSGPKL